MSGSLGLFLNLATYFLIFYFFFFGWSIIWLFNVGCQKIFILHIPEFILWTEGGTDLRFICLMLVNNFFKDLYFTNTTLKFPFDLLSQQTLVKPVYVLFSSV